MKIIHFETGPLCVNTYLCFDEESKKGFVVDPGGPSDKLIKSINDEGVSLDYIILTHGHCDHIGGVDYLMSKFPSAKIIASEKELEMLSDAKINESHPFFGKDIVINPDILVSDNEHIIIGNMDLMFISTPGHTKGGMCIYIPGVLFSGDTLFRHSIGRTDFYGGDLETLLRMIKNKLFLLPDDTVVLTGHDSSTTIGDEKRGNPFV